MKYFIKTFGCKQNKADSERIASTFQARGMTEADSYRAADYIVINTCMIRRSAEDRVYGLVKNLGKLKIENCKLKIIVTGCMVGLAYRDKTGKYLTRIRELMPQVDEFMPIEEVGFDSEPVRQNMKIAWVPISNGCNNFCTFCVVPFTRGREVSRPFEDIINECNKLKAKGYRSVTLLGQNVNSYGTDLVLTKKVDSVAHDTFPLRDSSSYFGNPLLAEPYHSQHLAKFKPVFVKHLGRYRIPTLFPYLLEEVASLGFDKVDFISSNPWDFSHELIKVIARNENITRTIHLPIQSGDDRILKRMNRWYTAAQYLELIGKLKSQIPNVRFTTDIIVGFCGETEEEFANTVKLAKLVGFEKAYISMYSQRPMTAATKVFTDNVPHNVKKQRWQILENLINKPNLDKIKMDRMYLYE
jgi:tRNA-2-methylthio-N6-dimethylallyladenosine synthase